MTSLQIEHSMFADGELYALVVAQNVSEIAPIASSDVPAMFEAAANFQHLSLIHI